MTDLTEVLARALILGGYIQSTDPVQSHDAPQRIIAALDAAGYQIVPKDTIDGLLVLLRRSEPAASSLNEIMTKYDLHAFAAAPKP